ncbi:PH domain-containing protein [Streptomyces sp. B8F3]|uniref:PH domain-containing protein n=1 Tax=unclassified Streptomyces TaxID=2593676 RepID=UPI00325E860B
MQIVGVDRESRVPDQAGPRLRPPQHRVDRRAVAWWRTQLLLAAAVPVAVLGGLGALIGPARFWLLAAGTGVAAAGLAVGLGLPRWYYRVHRWEVTDDAVYVRSGYFWVDSRIAPMSRIQTVDTERGPLQRAFGLAAVTVTTASAKGALRIEALDHEEAAELAERLALATQKTPGDAT